MPATRWRRRCSPTACISSAAASSITGRAASSAPAPRSPTRWCSSRAARAPSPMPARRRVELYDGLVAREPELLAVGALRRRRRRQRAVAADAGGLLLQDVHVAADAALVAALRALHPSRGGHGTRRRRRPIPTATSTSTRTATCSSSAAASPDWPRRVTAARAGARVIVCDEQSPRLRVERPRRRRRRSTSSPCGAMGRRQASRPSSRHNRT